MSQEGPITQEVPAVVAPGASMGGARDDLPHRRMTLAVIGVAVVLIVAAVVGLPHFFAKNSGKSSPLQLATAAIQSFPVTAVGNGVVVPASEVAVNFSTSGQLSAIDVSVGQKVTKGTVLAQLDNSLAESDVEHAQAAVASAQAALAAAEAPLNPGTASQLQSALTSAQSVYNQTVASVQATASQDAAVVAADNQQLASDQQRLTTDGCSVSQPSNALVCQDDQAAVSSDQNRLATDQARAQSDASAGQLRITQAQAAVSQANAALQSANTADPNAVAAAESGVSSADAQLQTAQDELADLTLAAPESGTVLQVNGQVGENVSGGATGAPTLPGTDAPIPDFGGTTSGSGAASNPGLIVLGSSSSYVVGAEFPSSDLTELVGGQSCTITDSSLTGLNLPCHVLAVSQTSTTVGGSAVVYASVTPSGPTRSLYSNMQVSVNVAVARAVNVLAVPQSAVTLIDGKPYVDVWTGSRSVPTAVTTSDQGTSLIEITSGLSSGQQVVLSADQGLSQTTLAGTP